MHPSQLNWIHEGYPEVGRVVQVRLSDETEVLAYWDGNQWMTGVDDDPEDAVLQDQALCWCVNEQQGSL